MFKNDSIIKSLHKSSKILITAGNQDLNARSEGNAIVNFGQEGNSVSLESTLHVPELSENLLLVSKLCDIGHRVVFTRKGCFIYSKNGLIGKGRREGNLYLISLSSQDFESANASSEDTNSNKSPIKVWHERLGHISEASIRSRIVTNSSYNNR